MRKRLALLTVAIVLVAIGIWWAVRSDPPAASVAKPASVASKNGSIPAAPPEAAPKVAASDGAASPEREQALVRLDKVRHMITDFYTLMGENPVGTNAEIMQALMGGNPREAVLGPPEGQTLNAKGELIDQWDTPYFFHQLSRKNMEILSAGPDKTLGTRDDVMLR